MREPRKGEALHWIAINGASCAHFALPLRWPFAVVPTPEWAFGFEAEDEAYAMQQKCLNDPIEDVRNAMRSWMDRSDVAGVKFKNPQPPTKGETLWMET